MSAQRSDGPPLLSGAHRRYEIVERVLGRKGVHLARQKGELGFSKLVDIKTIPGGQAEMVHALVVDEARLRHANIVSTIDVLVENGAVHVVMEHIDGWSLAEILQACLRNAKRLPVAVAATIMHDVLLGLDHAHGAHDATVGLASLLQCDVSPPNVLVGKDGLTRLIDLGAPRAPSSDETPRIGKPDYLAPEQLDGGSVDRTAEIYSCGVLLWELLTGTRLFKSIRSAADVVKPSARARGISGKLDAIVMRALHADPRERYQTAAYMAKALAEAVRLATRATVSEAVRGLIAGVDIVPTNDEPNARLERAWSRLTDGGRSLGERLRAIVPWLSEQTVRMEAALPRFYALTRRMRGSLRQLSFATRVLLAFSVVSIVALGLIAGRGRPTAKARALTSPAVASAPTTAVSAVALPSDPAGDAPIEIDDEPAPVTPVAAPPTPVKKAAARRVDPKPTPKSVASQLLH